ncbi:biotin/lipoate A/B protein ligase family protein [Paenibacillus yanchengensis]|uniref:Biotin/lipoate A/B protein ligase family protein n=1 Tax=Paenibacillus yanchengensis TaxID=2035833 RepID=A0ABW4YFY5_9BACL
MPQQVYFLDQFQLLDHHDPLYMFAVDEWLAEQINESDAAICHIWRHPQAFILGAQDSRLPNIRQAVQWLQGAGWHVAVRNSGGLAVPLDNGVVNISFIVPHQSGQQPDYWFDFEKMYQWIKKALQPTGKQVERGLIQGAYCPGDYDLSIDGWKFCGIAQRRKRKATIIQAFVIAEGDGVARAELARNFYYIASNHYKEGQFPDVTLESTASLQQLTSLGKEAASSFAFAFKQEILRYFAMNSDRYIDISPHVDQINLLTQKLHARYTMEGETK